MPNPRHNRPSHNTRPQDDRLEAVFRKPSDFKQVNDLTDGCRAELVDVPTARSMPDGSPKLQPTIHLSWFDSWHFAELDRRDVPALSNLGFRPRSEQDRFSIVLQPKRQPQHYWFGYMLNSRTPGWATSIDPNGHRPRIIWAFADRPIESVKLPEQMEMAMKFLSEEQQQELRAGSLVHDTLIYTTRRMRDELPLFFPWKDRSINPSSGQSLDDMMKPLLQAAIKDFNELYMVESKPLSEVPMGQLQVAG